MSIKRGRKWVIARNVFSRVVDGPAKIFLQEISLARKKLLLLLYYDVGVYLAVLYEYTIRNIFVLNKVEKMLKQFSYYLRNNNNSVVNIRHMSKSKQTA